MGSLGTATESRGPMARPRDPATSGLSSVSGREPLNGSPRNGVVVEAVTDHDTARVGDQARPYEAKV
jgi:hypothetical protein